jgi:hypothetical protein
MRVESLAISFRAFAIQLKLDRNRDELPVRFSRKNSVRDVLVFWRAGLSSLPCPVSQNVFGRPASAKSHAFQCQTDLAQSDIVFERVAIQPPTDGDESLRLCISRCEAPAMASVGKATKPSDGPQLFESAKSTEHGGCARLLKKQTLDLGRRKYAEVAQFSQKELVPIGD